MKNECVQWKPNIVTNSMNTESADVVFCIQYPFTHLPTSDACGDPTENKQNPTLQTQRGRRPDIPHNPNTSRTQQTLYPKPSSFLPVMYVIPQGANGRTGLSSHELPALRATFAQS